jgi:hypothetical protein
MVYRTPASRLRAAAALAGLCLALLGDVSAQRATRAAATALPPLSMTCTHHPDVIESRPGTCPFCKMALVPVRLDSAWMCPVHSVVQQEEPGTCRLCRRPLVQVTVSLTWTCRNEAGAAHLEPGTCADGTPRMARSSLRPHGNHNPQHGGQFFMAPDNWHHLEGTYPRDRVFRLYLYDDYARALGARRLRDVDARVVTKETFDPATRKTTELRSFRLTPSRDGTYMEARLDPMTLPAELTAKLRFGKTAPEYRFDFTFRELTRDPAPAPAATARTAQPPAKPAASGADTAPAVEAPVPPAPADPLLAELPPATTTAERLSQLQTRTEQIRGLIARGDFGAVWVPAFAAKELAVELEAAVPELPVDRRPAAGAALRELVRTSWLLDSVGDAGSRPDVERAQAAFTAALTGTLNAFRP